MLAAFKKVSWTTSSASSRFVHEVLSDAQEFSIVSLHKLFESSDIATLAGTN